MSRHPALYQINTRLLLTEVSPPGGPRATLDEIPDATIDRIAEMGFEWVWLLGAWEVGPGVWRAALRHRREYRQVLPDLEDADIAGSCFAIRGYDLDPEFGRDGDALERLRHRLRRRGLRLMLDFIPNHTGLDHPWAASHPEFFVRGTEEQIAAVPANWCRVRTHRGTVVLAHGRDPHFEGWSDTLQLDYANPELQEAMVAELRRVAERCDGLRCDMAMLLLPEVFERTWGTPAAPFWPRAIARVRESFPDFLFLAEVYWGLEDTLLKQGFDYAYDKTLYDRLRHGRAASVREHLRADGGYQERLARFLENHDEARAAAAFPAAVHEAAAVVTFLAPGLRLLHHGQLEGRRVRVPVQLRRGPVEPPDPEARELYERLLGLMRNSILRDGKWRLLECVPAWEGNRSSEGFIAFCWEEPRRGRWLVAVNFAPDPGQCHVPLPLAELRGRPWRLRDLLHPGVHYDRDGGALLSPGLYLDVAAWHAHVFELIPAD